MTDGSGIAAHDKANQINALSALYQAEQSKLNTLDGQTLVLAGLLVTYGIAAVATLGTDRVHTGWLFVALPVPAWIVLGYNAILWTRVTSHTAAANACRDALTDIAAIGETVPSHDEWRPWVKKLFRIASSRVLSYGVPFGVILVFTGYMLYRGSDSLGIWLAAPISLYVVGLVILVCAWVPIVYAGADTPASVRSWVRWIFMQP
jgi:hypothetical protein